MLNRAIHNIKIGIDLFRVSCDHLVKSAPGLYAPACSDLRKNVYTTKGSTAHKYTFIAQITLVLVGIYSSGIKILEIIAALISIR